MCSSESKQNKRKESYVDQFLYICPQFLFYWVINTYRTSVMKLWHVRPLPVDKCHETVTLATLLRDECHEFVTHFFNNGHPLPGAFSSDRLEYKHSNFEQILSSSGTYYYLLFFLKNNAK